MKFRFAVLHLWNLMVGRVGGIISVVMFVSELGIDVRSGVIEGLTFPHPSSKESPR